MDPQDLVNEVIARSGGRFTIGRQENASEFMVWFVNELHQGLASIAGGKKSGKKKKRTRTIITEVFEGIVEVTSISKRAAKAAEAGNPEDFDDSVTGAQKSNPSSSAADEDEFETKTVETPFTQLTLDILEKPLFKNDASGALMIPQDTLGNLLTKFNGENFVDFTARGVIGKRRYRIKKLPEYLVVHLGRFKKNNFSVEKNPTIVTFPIKNLDLNDFLYGDDGAKIGAIAVPSKEAVQSMGIKDMKELLTLHGRAASFRNVVEKEELTKLAVDLCEAGGGVNLNNVYDLVASTCHDTPASVGKEGQRDTLAEGSYRTQISHAASKQWFEVRELTVKDTLPESIVLCEALFLIFKKKGGA